MNKFPFVFGRPVSDNHFLDRDHERKLLKANFNYGINTILISPRRLGKTSLVKKVCREVESEKNLRIVFLDIFACRDEKDFARVFADALIRQTSGRLEEWINDAREFLANLNPQLSLSAGVNYSISLNFNPKDHINDLNNILTLPQKIADKKGCRLVICIDEFQQIGEFPDSLNFQRKLRTYWQHQPNVTFCLFGSKRHMMNELFQSSSHPFYKFGEVINLGKIPKEYWVQYINDSFEAYGFNIPKEVTDGICDFTECYSSYVQQLASLLFINFDENNPFKAFESACDLLLDHCSDLYEQQTQSLSSLQLNFLKALIQGVESEMMRKEVIERYSLGTPSNITRIRESLIKKEIIEITGKKITFTDPILKKWLDRKFQEQ